LRIVFMGSPRFSLPSLEQLLLNNYDVVAVYTQPDRPSGRGRALAMSPVKEAALKWKLPVKQPPALKNPNALKELAALKPDVIIVCAFGQILPKQIIDMPPRQCLNVHFSLLPRYRGASPVAAAILAGDEFTGVSIQLVRYKLDTGPVLASASIPIQPGDNTGTLSDKLSSVGARLLQEALVNWLNDAVEPLPQDESKATYFGQVKKKDGEIDWKLPALEIWRRVRAYYPWPGCFTFWQGNQLKINEAFYLPDGGKKEVGRVVALPEEEGDLGIFTGDGILVVRNIQYAGKRAMSVAEFLRGQRSFIGATLPS
jgi:methionyl-tRNA formyltransferase